MLRPVPCSPLREPSYFFDDHFTHFVQKCLIAFGLLRIGEVGTEYKVQVAFKGMAEDDSFG